MVVEQTCRVSLAGFSNLQCVVYNEFTVLHLS